MSTVIWRGSSKPVADVWTVVVGGTIANGQIYTVTIGNRSIAYTAVVGSDNNAAVASALKALLAAATVANGQGEFSEVTWTVSTTTITGTAKTAGVPITISSGATGTGTLVSTNTTVATGPNFWSEAANWSTGAVPVSTDTVYLQGSSVPILYGLGQSAVTLTALYADLTFTAAVGLPDYNANGYFEYRSRYLAISATTFNVGLGDSGGGSGMLRINLGSNASTINVYGTGTRSVPAIPALDLLVLVHPLLACLQ